MGDDVEEKQQLEGVTEVHDSDVLCGRGGAALRHAGNQTYRKLVSLNKGLYITCLKTEKLKISRSIVAAIREKNGRFLEKDAATGTWYDIGDKKAVEKTSQALREGQPKLRQQIVEMGGGAAGAASLIESQYGAQTAAAVTGAGLYPGAGMQQQQQQQVVGPHGQMVTPQHQQSQQVMRNGNVQQQMQQQRMMNQQGYAAMQQRQMQQQQMGALPFDDIQNDLMSRLSLHDDSNNGMAQPGNMRPPMQPMRQQVMANGMDQQVPVMADYGGYGGGINALGGVEDGVPMDNSFRAAMRGMASPGNSVAGSSLHSTLDFTSMHSMQDYMNGLSNHSMGPPSSHLPTMSSISRQQQIDERYPQNIGLGDHHPSGMGQQQYRRQEQDHRPPQPAPQEQRPGRMHGIAQQQQKMHPGQPSSRGYGGEQDLEPLSAFPGGSRSGYPHDQQQPVRSLSGGYPQDQSRRMAGDSRGHDDSGGQQNRNSVPNARGYNEPSRGVEARRSERSLEDERVMAPPDRNISSSTEGTSKGGVNQSAASVASNSTTPSVLRSETRQKMDRRNMFARMKFSRPPSARDQKMGLAGSSMHSTGDGMPDIHMVESQLSLHSTMSNMTDGNSTHNANNNAQASKIPSSGSKGPWVETTKVVDHSARSGDYMDVLATGSRHSLMSGLSKISDHSLNDASIFSSLSKQIGNVSTRSIAMSEISVIDVAERDGEDEPASDP